MLKAPVAAIVAGVLLAQTVTAAEREVIRTDWSGFKDQVSARKIANRSVRVSLTSGGEIKARLDRVTDTGLRVSLNRATRQWKTGEDKAEIPRDQVTRVRFSGRVGTHKLVGALAGTGAGAGIAAAILTGVDVYEGIGVILLPVLGVFIALMGTLTGYFVGRATGHAAPEFEIPRPVDTR